MALRTYICPQCTNEREWIELRGEMPECPRCRVNMMPKAGIERNTFRLKGECWSGDGFMRKKDVWQKP